MNYTSNKIQYAQAFNSKGKIVHISEVWDEEETFTCIGCGKPMIAKKGDILAHHFAHKSDCACNGETYLHELAKAKFLEAWSETTSFNLYCIIESICKSYRDSNCHHKCRKNKLRKINLKEHFDICEKEKMHEGFRPDILLKNSKNGKVIFIEFSVTHQCEKNKIDSRIPIIEFDIKNESNCDFSLHQIKLSDFTNYNFKLSKKEELENVEHWMIVVYDPEGKQQKWILIKDCRTLQEKAFSINQDNPYAIFIFRKDAWEEGQGEILPHPHEWMTYEANKSLHFLEKDMQWKSCHLCRFSKRRPPKLDVLLCSKQNYKQISKESWGIGCEHYILSKRRMSNIKESFSSSPIIEIKFDF